MKILIFVIIFFFYISGLFAQEKICQINLPEGHKRISFPSDSYSKYIQNLPLKQNNTIKEWDGSKLWISLFLYDVLAVVNKPILFNEDLEQCADYSMRFWADFHKDVDKLKQLYLFDYEGNKKFFKDSKKKYLRYLRWHMAFSNSFSIKNGAKKINMSELLKPGDMFVQNTDGGVGHVSVVVDAAENENKERIYLIGYSYMPAQEFHIEDAENRDETGAWFTKEGYIKYLAENRLSKYGDPVLRRF